MATDDPDLDTVHDRASFGAALSRLRATRDLSVRDLARSAGQPVSTVGGWCSGRSLPQRSQRAAVLAVLAACEVEGDRTAAWIAALERARAEAAVPTRGDVAPYRGLLPYEAADAGWFFGRGELTAQLLDRVATAARATGGRRVLAVVGPSGSGKSSVLRAGLVPTVALEGVAGTDTVWTAEVMTPGEDPRAALASRPSAGTTDAPAPPTLLVVDQFEEVFSPAVDDATRLAFLDDLFAAADAADRPTVVVLGMRADFYANAAADARLARVLQDGQVVVGPMGEADLRAAVVEPARHAGVVVETDLVERLLREMGVTGAGGRPDTGALPLLSHALRATWERSSGRRRLTTAHYEATGGLGGSIEQSAEAVLHGLDDDGRAFARRLFTRLVRVDEATGTLTRRAVDPTDLPAADAPGAATTAAVLDAFIARRLLTVDAGTVDISHERLLTAWPRIGEWLEADRDLVRARHQLADAVRAWQGSGRDPAFLLTGTRLAAAADLLDTEDLTTAERALVTASVDAVQADRSRARRRLRRTRQLLVLVAVLAVVASTAGIVALRAGSAADTARRRAEADGRASLSRQVAIEARQLTQRDPALAQQLAVLAWRTSPTAEARGALLDQSTTPVVSRVLGGQGPTAVAVSGDGRILAVGRSDDGSVHLSTLRPDAAPSPLAVIPDVGGEVYALRWSGPVLAVGVSTGAVTRWDLASGRPVPLGPLTPSPTGAVQGITVSPDGRLLAVASAGDDPVRVWDVSTPSVARFLTAPPGVTAGATEQSVAFSPDGRDLVAGGTGGDVYAWRTADLTAAPRVLPSATGSTVNAVAFEPSGRQVLTGDRLGTITVRDADTLATVATRQLPTNGWVDGLAFSPDGTELAIGTSDATLQRFGVDPWTPRQRTGAPGPVTGVTYTPDGHDLVSTTTDGTARIVGVARQITVGADAPVFALSPDAAGDDLAVTSTGTGATAQVWDTSDADHPRPAGAAVAPAGLDGTGAVSPDGRVLATGTRDGTVQLWATDGADDPSPLGAVLGIGAFVETLTFSPDGHTLAVGSDDHTLQLWDVRDPASPARLAALATGNNVVGAAFSPDGTRVAAASLDHFAYLWDVRSPDQPRRVGRLGGFANYVWSVAFRPDGRVLAAVGADGSTRLWDVSGAGTPDALATITGPRGYNVGVAFSPDGRELAVGSHDENVWLYDVARPSDPHTLATLAAVGGNVNVVTYLADGRLAAAGYAAAVPVWDTDPDAVAARICASAGDRVTPDEWRQYVPGAPYDPPC